MGRSVARGTNRKRNYADETPRMVMFNNKLAVAQGDTSGVKQYSFGTTSQTWGGNGGSVGVSGYPLDMQTAFLNGDANGVTNGVTHPVESLMVATDGTSNNVLIYDGGTGTKKF